MKKIIPPKLLPSLVLLGSLLGVCLRLWIVGDGPNAAGLYPDPMAPWIALWIITAHVLAVIILGVLPLKNPGTYEENYPVSVFGFIGSILAGLAMIYSGYSMFHTAETTLKTIGGILGVAGGVTLLVAGYSRLKGIKCHFLLHLVPCLALALRLFLLCQEWSNITQLSIFVFPFLASLAMMLAAYQRTCFDVGVGKRRHSVFWSLLSVYLCILALVPVEGVHATASLLENADLMFYAAMAIWLVSDLCSLRPVKRKAPQPEQTPAEPEPAEPAPAPGIKIDIPLDAEPKPEVTTNPTPTSAPPLMPEEMSLEQLQDWLDQQ